MDILEDRFDHLEEGIEIRVARREETYMNDVGTSRELTVDTFNQMSDGRMQRFLIDWTVATKYVDEVTGFFP
jgi:hypothetical protein